MAYTSRIEWEPLRSMDASLLTGSYQALGFSSTPLVAAPLLHPSYKCKLVNNSNVLITISNDGITDKDVAPGNSYWVYDEGLVGDRGQAPALPNNTQIYIKGSAGVGMIYFVTQYIISL